jgi:hypothetical protein
MERVNDSIKNNNIQAGYLVSRIIYGKGEEFLEIGQPRSDEMMQLVISPIKLPSSYQIATKRGVTERDSSDKTKQGERKNAHQITSCGRSNLTQHSLCRISHSALSFSEL